MIKVLHCPYNVGSHPACLSKFERRVGLASDAYFYNTHKFQTEHFGETIIKKNRSAWLNELTAWKFLISKAMKYDVIHYNFGSTIIPVKGLFDSINIKHSAVLRNMYKKYIRFFDLRELKWLKKKGKRIFVTFQGDDARLVSYHKKHFEITPVLNQEYYKTNLKKDSYNQYRIQMFTKYADKIFALNPDLLYVLPPEAEFLPYSPLDLTEWKYLGVEPKERLKIVHAPTERYTKGTKYIIDAVEKLRSEGYNFEFLLIENVPRQEAKKIFEQADILIDQLLIGWYGGLGLEFMALGKPVVCYIRREDLKFIPEKMKAELPVIDADPHTIYAVLKDCLTVNKEKLPEIGELSRKYAENWHDPLKIAEKMKAYYEASLG